MNPNSPRKNRFKNTIPDSPENEPEPNKKGPNKKRRRWIIAITAIVGVLLVIFGIAKYRQANDAVNSLFSSANIAKSRNVNDALKKNKPISILLLGTDTGALGRNYRGRTDTIIVATLNPGKEKMTLTSIPRDTAIVIPGYEDQGLQKINAAYDLGGAGTAIKAVQKLLNVPIDFYGLINMGGLEKIVDGVGGIDVTPKLTFKYGKADVVKGQKIHLDGAAALDYSRMRHSDPQGDYGRQTRQRQVLMAILRKSDSVTTLVNQKFMDSLKKQTQTDLTFSDLVALSTNYRVATHHLKSTHLQGGGQQINGIDYEVAERSEMQRVTNFIRNNLNLAKADTGKTGYGDTDSSSESNTDSTSDSNASYSDSTGTTATDNTTTSAPTNETTTNSAPASSREASVSQAPEQSQSSTQSSSVTSQQAAPAQGGNNNQNNAPTPQQ